MYAITGAPDHVRLPICALDFPSREGASVLVHGTEGTDSTLQVTSLAQIILEPRSRTIRGFEALIEREWLQVSRAAGGARHCQPPVLRRAGLGQGYNV